MKFFLQLFKTLTFLEQILFLSPYQFVHLHVRRIFQQNIIGVVVVVTKVVAVVVVVVLSRDIKFQAILEIK